MSKKIVVYLSGPITKGDRSHNICQFMQAHEMLLKGGFSVINPGLTGMLPWAWEYTHDDWIQSDLPIIERCDLLIRLPGESIGADMEEAHALKHGIPVVHVSSIQQVSRVRKAVA